MPIHGQLIVRALNDGFKALNSVPAMSQSGRQEFFPPPLTTSESSRPEAAGRKRPL
jgi:hypothetical protein